MSLAVKVARAGSQGAYRGPVDRGGLGGFFKGLAKGAAGFLVGGPAGAAAAVLPGLVGGGGRGSAGTPMLAPPPPPQVVRSPGLGGLIARTVPGGRTGYEVATVPQGGGCPSGFHPNKTEYFLKDGTFVPKGSRCVKNRRRNPLNPRAADRAMSRLTSAKKAAQKLNRISIRKPRKC